MPPSFSSFHILKPSFSLSRRERERERGGVQKKLPSNEILHLKYAFLPLPSLLWNDARRRQRRRWWKCCSLSDRKSQAGRSAGEEGGFFYFLLLCWCFLGGMSKSSAPVEERRKNEAEKHIRWNFIDVTRQCTPFIFTFQLSATEELALAVCVSCSLSNSVTAFQNYLKAKIAMLPYISIVVKPN